ncbi:TRAP transporter large permease [Mameliella alba]|nr:TRAP transporter large permease [Antarctobacter heliothermus]MBY6144454.1 TRAP transporter large permease [Mameliella alba]MCA0954503.1 TRAP transporter large permease [Mameliella alba]
MSNLEIGFYGIGLMMVLLAIRVPIAVSLGTVSLGGLYLIRGERAALGTLGDAPYDFAATWALSAVPMFLLMGTFAQRSGMAARLFTAARVLIGHLPGGLAISTNFAAAGFAAVSGSTLATTAAMSRLAVPEMLKHNYDKALATSVVAAAGTLGALIPPSVAFVIYGWYSSQSISKLLLAGIVPGVLTALVYCLMIYLRVKRTPALAPMPETRPGWDEKWQAIRAVWPLPVIVFGVVLGIYTGTTTPTEAGAAAAFLTLIVAIANGEMNWSRFIGSLSDAARTTALLFFVIIGTVLFTHFLTLSGVPRFIARAIQDNAVDPFIVMLMICALFLVLGMFLEGLGVMLVSLPILLPIAESVGYDLIWFGVIVVKFVEIGLLTPPVGMNAFVVKGVVGDEVTLGQIFRGLTWFLAAEVLIMAILIGFPQLSLFLPSLLN